MCTAIEFNILLGDLKIPTDVGKALRTIHNTLHKTFEEKTEYDGDPVALLVSGLRGR